MDYESLMREAASARKMAYAPYSGFLVGAALLCADGKVYCGCNVENVSFSMTNCAERTAVFKAISEGERSFVALAVTGGKGEEPDALCTPCGACRQVLAEFCSASFPVVLGREGELTVKTLGELLPYAFSSVEEQKGAAAQ